MNLVSRKPWMFLRNQPSGAHNVQITQATECLLPTLTPLLPAYSLSALIQRGNETGFEQDRTPEILENKNLIIILLDFIKLLRMKINKNQIQPNQRGRNQK